MKQTTLIVFGWLMLSLTAQAASFDCAKAGTKVERLVCGDAELSKLDEELSVAYKAALQDEKQVDTTKQAQKQWLKERNSCSDAACVKQAYETRLTTLRSADGVDEQYSATLALMPSGVPTGTPTFKFSLEKGSDLEVCRDYLKNLQAVQPTETSLACEVTLDPSLKQFGFPKWEELVIKDNWDIVYDIEKRISYFFYYNKDASKKDWEKDYENKTRSGEIKPRLRRANVRLSANAPELTIFGYTKRRDNIDVCKKNVEEDKFRNIYLGESVFIYDKSRNTVAVIVNGDPNQRDTELGFDVYQEHLVITHNAALFFSDSFPSIDGYRVIVYGIDMPYFPRSPDMDIYSYHGKYFCEITARNNSTSKQKGEHVMAITTTPNPPMTQAEYENLRFAIIKQFEASTPTPTPYFDTKGIITIGIGFNIDTGNTTLRNLVMEKMGLTTAQKNAINALWGSEALNAVRTCYLPGAAQDEALVNLFKQTIGAASFEMTPFQMRSVFDVIATEKDNAAMQATGVTVFSYERAVLASLNYNSKFPPGNSKEIKGVSIAINIQPSCHVAHALTRRCPAARCAARNQSRTVFLCRRGLSLLPPLATEIGWRLALRHPCLCTDDQPCACAGDRR